MAAFDTIAARDFDENRIGHDFSFNRPEYPTTLRASAMRHRPLQNTEGKSTIKRATPEIDAVLASNAVGRDFLASGRFMSREPQGDLHLTLYGLIGLSAGVKRAAPASAG